MSEDENGGVDGKRERRESGACRVAYDKLPVMRSYCQKTDSRTNGLYELIKKRKSGCNAMLRFRWCICG